MGEILQKISFSKCTVEVLHIEAIFAEIDCASQVLIWDSGPAYGNERTPLTVGAREKMRKPYSTVLTREYSLQGRHVSTVPSIYILNFLSK